MTSSIPSFAEVVNSAKSKFRFVVITFHEQEPVNFGLRLDVPKF